MAADLELRAPKPAQIPGTHGSSATTVYRDAVYAGQYYSVFVSQGHTVANQPQPVVSDVSLDLVMLNRSTSETMQRQSQVETATPNRNSLALSEETLVETATSSWEEKDSASFSDGTANETTQASLGLDDCDIFLSYSSRIEASIPAHLKSQQPTSIGGCTLVVSPNKDLETAVGTRDPEALVRSPNRNSYLRHLRAAAGTVQKSPRLSQLAQSVDDGTQEASDVGATLGEEGWRDERQQQDMQGHPIASIQLSASANVLKPGSTNPGKVGTPAARHSPPSHSPIVYKSRKRASARTVSKTLAQSTSTACSEEGGGCRLTAKVDVQGGDVFDGQGNPGKETRNKELAQAESKSKVQEDVLSTTQYGASASVRLNPTKNAKFDSLVRKLQVKGLLGENTTREVHVFVDMSNIYIGFQDFSKESRGYRPGLRAPYEPFSFEHFSYILERGRSIGKRHLAGSIRYAKQWNNLPRHFVEARRCGYTTKIFQQVEKPDASHSNSSPNTSSDEWDTSLDLGTLCPRTKLGEQGVDETLHLAMQDSMLEAKEPGVMVLATGDAKPAEFSDGFAHYATKALERGWYVEIVSWRRCLSSEWSRTPFCDKYAGQIRIVEVEDLFDEMRANWIKPSLPTPMST